MVGERDVIEDEAIVVGVEGSPAAVRALHAEKPGQAARTREAEALGFETLELLERHQHHPGVVEVRIEVVVVLERPPAWLEVRPLDLPVAGDQDLPVQQPRGGAGKRGMVGGEVALDQGVDRQTRVPDRRRAGLIVDRVLGLHGEGLELLELAPDQRVVVGIAEGPEGEHRIRHGREDPAKPARHGQPLLEPEPRCLDGPLAEGARREPLPDLERVVDGNEEVLPEEPADAEGDRPAGQPQARRLARLGPELVKRPVGGQPFDRLAVHQDQERYDDRARPVRDLVEVEVEAARQEHDLDRHRRHAVPVVLAEEGQQDLRKDVGPTGASHRTNHRAGADQVRVVGWDPRHLHREVGLDRGGEIGGPGLEEAPAAVRELSLAQVGDGLALALGVDPVEEVAEQQELRRDGGVGFQLADPLPVGGLSTEERRLGARNRRVEACHGFGC